MPGDTSFQKVPRRIISQAGLFDAVEALASNVNALVARMDQQDIKLDLIVEILNGRTAQAD